jgi:hypothetical protein
MPFLRTSREFPEEIHSLSVEVNKSYVDIANAVNNRTIGVFPTVRAALTGESWFLTGNQLQQSIRQVYTFLAAQLPNIPHGINTANISNFTAIYGTLYDGTSWYPLPYVDVVAANNQINVIVNATNIVITLGAGSPPAITSGIVVLEWLLNA